MLIPNYAKLNFSRTITDQEGGFITSDVCHNYGIMGGCDAGCPSLLDGTCRYSNFRDAVSARVSAEKLFGITDSRLETTGEKFLAGKIQCKN